MPTRRSRRRGQGRGHRFDALPHSRRARPRRAYRHVRILLKGPPAAWMMCRGRCGHGALARAPRAAEHVEEVTAPPRAAGRVPRLLAPRARRASQRMRSAARARERACGAAASPTRPRPPSTRANAARVRAQAQRASAVGTRRRAAAKRRGGKRDAGLLGTNAPQQASDEGRQKSRKFQMGRGSARPTRRVSSCAGRSGAVAWAIANAGTILARGRARARAQKRRGE